MKILSTYVLCLLMLSGLLFSPVAGNAQMISDIHSSDSQNPEISLLDFRYDTGTSGALTHLRVNGANGDASSRSFFQTISESPGLSFLSSAILPGFGQAAHGQWWKTAIFAGIEAGAIYLYFDQRSKAQRIEREYWQMADDHWSVVQYAQFLVDYSQLDFDITDVLTEEGLERYMANGYIEPAFSNDIDWNTIDLPALNAKEYATLFRTTGNPFSHGVPEYGSQQYYELVSKYFQFAPGWRDWNGDVTVIDQGINGMSPMWLEHARLESDFNETYRFADNMIVVLLANHIFSAFDAFFVSRLRLHRNNLQTSASLTHAGPNVNLKISF